MKVSFNGMRRNIFNSYVRYILHKDQDSLVDLHNAIVAMMCIYDNSVPDDFDDLSNMLDSTDFQRIGDIIEEMP